MTFLQIERMMRSVLFLALILAGLLSWTLRPAGIPPGDQLRSAASVAGFLILMAACAGIAAMATVQFWKALFRPRAAFHAAELDSYFGEHTYQVLGLAAPTRPETGSTVAPALAKRSAYLLDNPTEIVMGQVRSAADYILLRPAGFEAALTRLAGSAGKAAVKEYLAALKPQESETSESKMAGQDSAKDSVRSDDALEAVRFFVEQRLNLAHVSMRERWRHRVRIVAVVVAGLTGLLAVLIARPQEMVAISVICAAAVWGGFFSWLARDLVALVERGRT
jgi:hypothetical protein